MFDNLPGESEQDRDRDGFALRNDPPRRRASASEIATERATQRTLFAGLDCLPDQRDLFATDGEELVRD
jgi:hypothetical protein